MEAVIPLFVPAMVAPHPHQPLWDVTIFVNRDAALEKTELRQGTEQVYMNATNTASKTASKTISLDKLLACIFTSIAAMTIILVVCIASFSAEIAELKAKTASVQAQIALEAENNNETLQYLKSSLHSSLGNWINQHIYPTLDNHTLQLSDVKSTMEILSHFCPRVQSRTTIQPTFRSVCRTTSILLCSSVAHHPLWILLGFSLQ